MADDHLGLFKCEGTLRRQLEGADAGEIHSTRSTGAHSTARECINPSTGSRLAKSRGHRRTVKCTWPRRLIPPGRRHVQRASHWRRTAPRHVEVLQPDPRAERSGALGDRGAGHRARRAERATQAAWVALCAGYLHGESRHDRRHGQQQLLRRQVGLVREDDRPCSRARHGAVRRITGAPAAAESRGAGGRLRGRHARSTVLSHRPAGGARVRRGNREAVSEGRAPRGRLQS